MDSSVFFLDHILSESVIPLYLFLFPVFSGLLFLFLRNAIFHNIIRPIAVSLSLLPFLLSLYIFIDDSFFLHFSFNLINSSFFGEMDGFVIDSVSILLIMVTTAMVTFVFILSPEISGPRSREFILWVFLVEAASLGVFLANDLIVFYVLFEIMIIPIAFLITIWGNGEDRWNLVVRFICYTFLGSLCMLFSIVFISSFLGSSSFGDVFYSEKISSLSYSIRLSLFLSFMLAFCIKIPIFPFHSWLYSIYKASPLSVNVILTAIISKTGLYGIIKIVLPVFPDISYSFSGFFVVLGLISLLYASIIACAQVSIKQVITYSSMAHLGMILSGIFAWVFIVHDMADSGGLNASVYQMFNHSIVSGGLFLCALVLFSRSKSLHFNKLGGLSSRLPVLSVLFFILGLASMAVPGTNSFIGEFIIFYSVFKMDIYIGLFFLFAIIVSSLYVIRFYQGTFWGKSIISPGLRMNDVNLKETIVLSFCVILCLLGGIFPELFLERIK